MDKRTLKLKGHTYRIQQFTALIGSQVAFRISRAVTATGGDSRSYMNHLSEEDFEYLQHHALNVVRKEKVDPHTQTVSLIPVYNTSTKTLVPDLTNDGGSVYKLVMKVLEVNLEDFFTEDESPSQDMAG